jgi:hypothetical protein
MTLLGDVTGDGTLSTTDAVWVLQYTQGLRQLTPDQLRAADVSGNGSVTLQDAVLLFQATTTPPLITTFPAGPFLMPLPPLPSVVTLFSDASVQAIRRVRCHWTGAGWLVTWVVNRTDRALRDPLTPSELWAAGVDAALAVTLPARKILDIHRLDREPVYLACWHPTAGVLGICVAELTNYAQVGPLKPDGSTAVTRITEQRLYTLTTAGVLSGPVTLRNDLGVHGGVGDMLPIANDPTPGPAGIGGPGWLIGIETDCFFSPAHQCTWVYKCGVSGTPNRPRGLDITLIFGGAHETIPTLLLYNADFMCLCVRDNWSGANAGVLAHLVPHQVTGVTSRTLQVIQGGPFLIETDLQCQPAPDGSFAALWRERVSQTEPGIGLVRPRLVHFAIESAPVTLPKLTVLSDTFLEPPANADAFGDAGHWTCRLLRTGAGWACFYPVLSAQGVQWRRTDVADAGGVQRADLVPVADTASVHAERGGGAATALACATAAREVQIKLL